MGRIASSSFFLFFLFTNQQQTAAYKLGSIPLSSRFLILVVTKHFLDYHSDGARLVNVFCDRYLIR